MIDESQYAATRKKYLNSDIGKLVPIYGLSFLQLSQLLTATIVKVTPGEQVFTSPPFRYFWGNYKTPLQVDVSNVTVTLQDGEFMVVTEVTGDSAKQYVYVCNAVTAEAAE